MQKHHSHSLVAALHKCSAPYSAPACCPDLCAPYASLRCTTCSCRPSKPASHVWQLAAFHVTSGLICFSPCVLPQSDQLRRVQLAGYDGRDPCLQWGLLSGCFGTAAAPELPSTGCSSHGWHAPTVTPHGAGRSPACLPQHQLLDTQRPLGK